MPKIDMNEYNAAAVSTGEYNRMGAGGYVCQIQAVRTKGEWDGKPIDFVEEKQYVKLIWDVAEGEFAGRFSDDYWSGEEKDWGHQFFMSWKNMGVLKNVIQCLDESNPGFDAMAAFEADKWELFIGKYIGLVLEEEEYLGNDGNVKVRFKKFPRAKSVQDIRDGKFKVKPLQKLDTSDDATDQHQAPAKVDAYDDVPF